MIVLTLVTLVTLVAVMTVLTLVTIKHIAQKTSQISPKKNHQQKLLTKLSLSATYISHTKIIKQTFTKKTFF